MHVPYGAFFINQEFEFEFVLITVVSCTCIYTMYIQRFHLFIYIPEKILNMVINTNSNSNSWLIKKAP
jgi:hypothetical protein